MTSDVAKKLGFGFGFGFIAGLGFELSTSCLQSRYSAV
jgi:hypothetical protein